VNWTAAEGIVTQRGCDRSVWIRKQSIRCVWHLVLTVNQCSVTALMQSPRPIRLRTSHQCACLQKIYVQSNSNPPVYDQRRQHQYYPHPLISELPELLEYIQSLVGKSNALVVTLEHKHFGISSRS
jgi:hypothetical protein